MKQNILLICLGIMLISAVSITLRYYNRSQGELPTFTPDTPSVSSKVPIGTSFCADTLAVTGGTLCAIQPSITDPNINDTAEITGVRGDAILGFGYHVIGIPDNLADAKGIWIHFTGAYGRPYDVRTDSYGNAIWLSEIVAQGYVVIQLAYDNRFSVNGDLCGTQNEGHDRDNCAGEVREIALSGAGTSPYRSTDSFNTIDYRLSALLDFLQETHGINLPGSLDSKNVDWGQIYISGHSQGGNQAYYLAKQRLVKAACILAAGYDTGDSINPGEDNIADWISRGTSTTPLSNIHALLVTSDDSYQAFLAGLTKVIGLPSSQIVIADVRKSTDENGEALNGHAATVKDPTLKQQRAEACF